ncbi:carbamoyltransferase HypF [Vibrio mytili]|uniref:carbamoyltransferase HypF n=1 Tax=Vibrio mytili TaxID=50718 RepID=UPI002F3F531C
MMRCLIEIKGQVQGVGFRPFVYGLAIEHQLKGWVINDARGVRIDVQGEQRQFDAFYRELLIKTPPLARVDNIELRPLALADFTEFRILPSRGDNEISVSVPPDQAICMDCRRELFDPNSRFYHYPFINCTHCGPRYTIIKALPYDRHQTSMKGFKLCPDCARAYQNPMDRRYHAQPVSCAHCGPSVALFSPQQTRIAKEHQAIERAAEQLIAGGVIALKGLGGFHLVCDATSYQAVARLRELKHRARKPLAVMVSDVTQAKHYVQGEALEWQTLKSQASPIVLMRKAERADEGRTSIADNVAPNVDCLGVMLAYTPLHLLLIEALQLRGCFAPLVMTSANVSGLPLATEAQQVFAMFGASLDSVLDHNRPIIHACDDSLVQLAAGSMRVLRMARGYGPLSFPLENHAPATLAVGAQQKSTVAFAVRNQWFLSSYLGDINDLDTQQRFIDATGYFPDLYQASTERWVSDAHPGYFSTQWVNEQTDSALQVQHHYAHILAVMAESQLNGPVLGVSFDGTGAGDDGTVWGGEVMIADRLSYERIAHLRPFRLIGGEQAIREPERVLYALLLEIMTPEQIQQLNLPAFASWSASHFQNLFHLWRNAEHSPLCSSVGRLFDAWACLLSLVMTPDYEGESGLQMENAARQAGEHQFALALPWCDQQLDWAPALQQCLAQHELSSERWACICSDAFISALAQAVVDIAQQHPNLPLVLSGGVFQNRCLLDAIDALFPDSACPFITGSHIPVNDSGIAAGQLWHQLAYDI